MYFNELKTHVAHLGFENYIEDESLFVDSANRALSLIYTDRPVSKTAIVVFSGPRIELVREFIEHTSGSVITIPFNGKSISFRSSGRGTCIITDRTGSNTVPLSIKDQITKQYVFGEGNITFSGDFYFTISNLVVFKDVISNNTPDIPEYTPYRELYPADWCRDFHSFSKKPYDEYGNEIESVKLEGGRIIVPYDFRGKMYITYHRTPTPISADTKNIPIDISNECVQLLPLLTASFMWLDDDAAKAQYYMSLYRDLVANIKRYSTDRIDAEYRVNGWA